MSFAEPRAPLARRVHLEVAFLVAALRDGCLAASPFADPALDPEEAGAQEEAPETAFVFADIPDMHFREPQFILKMSEMAGGVKS